MNELDFSISLCHFTILSKSQKFIQLMLKSKEGLSVLVLGFLEILVILNLMLINDDSKRQSSLVNTSFRVGQKPPKSEA